MCNKVKCSSRVKNILIGLVDPRYLCVATIQELTKPIKNNLNKKIRKLSAGVNNSAGSKSNSLVCQSDQNKQASKEIILACVPFYFARGCISYDFGASCSSKVNPVKQ